MAPKRSKRRKRRRQTVKRQGEPQQPEQAIVEAAPADPAYPSVTGPWGLHASLFTGLIVITVLLYSGIVDTGFFVIDDEAYVEKNPLIRGASWENLKRILSEPYFYNYSPSHLLSYVLDYEIGGLDPRVYHLSSNLWAGVSSGLVYLVGLVLFGRALPAFAAACLFAVHPVHVEAVAWISSRKDLVATAFALASVLAYVRYRRGPGAGWWLGAAIVLFFLGVSGKQSVVVLPGVFIALDLFVERRYGWGVILDKIPFVLAAGFFALKTGQAQPGTGHSHDLFTIGYTSVANLWLLTGFGEYTLLRLRPSPPNSALLLWTICFVPILLVGAACVVTGLSVTPRRFPRSRPAALLWWLLLALLPPLVIPFVHPVADRYLFFPSIPALLALGLAGWVIARRFGRRGVVLALSLLGILAILWTTRTLAYLEEWRDPRTALYAASKRSFDPALHTALGGVYVDTTVSLPQIVEQGGAKRQWLERLAEVCWDGEEPVSRLFEEWDAGSTRGPLTRKLNRRLLHLGLETLDVAVQHKGTRVNPPLYLRRGNIRFNLGELDEAEKEFHRALSEARRNNFRVVEFEVLVGYSLGLVAQRRGDHKEAAELMRRAEDLQTRAGEVWVPGIGEVRKRAEQAAGLQE